MGKYSVLMSLYIKENPVYLRESIESMLNQTILPDEIIIVKDGPLTEELDNVLNNYQKNYPEIIKIIVSKKNIGLGQALNLGLEYCSNELVARMDTDDISLSERCEEQINAFKEDKDLVILGTMVDEFNDPGTVISTRIVPITHNDIYQFGKRRSPFNHPSVMYKRSKVLECGGYSNLRRNQDVDLFGRMLFMGHKSSNIEKSLVLFRSNNDLSRRRKSWENTKSYIMTIFKFYRMGYSGIMDVIIVSVGQLVMFISPLSVQNIIYRNFLRKS